MYFYMRPEIIQSGKIGLQKLMRTEPLNNLIRLSRSDWNEENSEI